MKIEAIIEELHADYGGHILSGHVNLFGGFHHVRFIKVKDDKIVEPYDDAPEEVKEIFGDLQHYWEGAYETITLPGIPGRFVLSIFPFSI